jgi:hypothetical protein
MALFKLARRLASGETGRMVMNGEGVRMCPVSGFCLGTDWEIDATTKNLRKTRHPMWSQSNHRTNPGVSITVHRTLGYAIRSTVSGPENCWFRYSVNSSRTVGGVLPHAYHISDRSGFQTQQFLFSLYEDRLKNSWTGGSALLLCCYASLCITAVHCHQSTNFSNGPRMFFP